MNDNTDIKQLQVTALDNGYRWAGWLYGWRSNEIWSTQVDWRRRLKETTTQLASVASPLCAAVQYSTVYYTVYKCMHFTSDKAFCSFTHLNTYHAETKWNNYLLCSRHVSFFTRESRMLRASLPSSGRPSVRPSHSWAVSKRCKLGSRNLHRGLPQGL